MSYNIASITGECGRERICVMPEGLLHPSLPILATGRSCSFPRSQRGTDRENGLGGKIKKGTSIVHIVILSQPLVHMRYHTCSSL